MTRPLALLTDPWFLAPAFLVAVRDLEEERGPDATTMLVVGEVLATASGVAEGAALLRRLMPLGQWVLPLARYTGSVTARYLAGLGTGLALREIGLLGRGL